MSIGTMKNFPALLITLTLLTTLGSFGCGQDDLSSVPEASPACGTNETRIAVIGVHDGFLDVLCGCNEKAGTSAIANQTLTCTITGPAHITFQYVATTLDHQIVFDNPAIPSSPLSSEDSSQKIDTHSVFIQNSGTYTFSDQLLRGQIVVQ